MVKNQGPQKVGTTPDQTVKVKGNTILGLGTYFDSVDGDTLTYTVSSADKAKATVSVDKNGLLTITGVAIGTTTITAMVTESDLAKLTATQTFDVTVNQSNRAPTAVGTIAAMTASVSKGNETLDASSYFSDADGDTLTYTATSSAVSKATVSVSGATVTITPVAAGPATITVKATDPEQCQRDADLHRHGGSEPEAGSEGLHPRARCNHRQGGWHPRRERLLQRPRWGYLNLHRDLFRSE